MSDTVETLTRTVTLAVEGVGYVTVIVQVPAGCDVLLKAILGDAMRTAIDGTIGA